MSFKFSCRRRVFGTNSAAGNRTPAASAFLQPESLTGVTDQLGLGAAAIKTLRN